MFEDLYDEKDLEFTEHRLRVHVMTLKKSGDTESLFRLYGVLAKVLALRGNHLKAQDALNDAEFLLVENHWRGSVQEIWCHLDRAEVFQALGRAKSANRDIRKADSLYKEYMGESVKVAIELSKKEAEALNLMD